MGCKEEAVRDFVRAWLDRNAKSGSTSEPLEGATNFVATGVINSMKFVNLLMDTENEFDIELDFSELNPSEFLTIDGFASCVISCQNNA
ncbi:MAG: acyl carrier protein [Pirellulales bacterium]|nr:acyl carrier protein [Pirellulales bacterium]